MGLMYIFPNDINDTEHVILKDGTVTLRTYGLPPLFWGYGAAILTMIIILTLSIWGPLEKLLSYNDQVNNLIGYSLISFLIALPVTLISFFFYEKNITKNHNELTITHKLFFMKISQKNYQLLENIPFEIKHYLDTPNMARMHDLKELKGFANKGYFVLMANIKGQVQFQIDRSSRKIDLEKMAKILN